MKPANVTFLHGDINAVEKTFTPEMLARLPQPKNLDETSPDVPKELGMGLYLDYEAMGDLDKFEELEKFVGQHKGHYAIDSFFNDFFGYNFTTSWNAILRRMN